MEIFKEIPGLIVHYSCGEPRTVYFRPERLELVECPLPAYETFMANMQKIEEEYEPIRPPSNLKSAKKDTWKL